MRRRLGLSGLGGAGFRLEAVEPELGVERWDWDLDGLQSLGGQGAVAVGAASRCFPHLIKAFLGLKIMPEEVGGRPVGIGHAGQIPVRTMLGLRGNSFSGVR